MQKFQILRGEKKITLNVGVSKPFSDVNDSDHQGDSFLKFETSQLFREVKNHLLHKRCDQTRPVETLTKYW